MITFPTFPQPTPEEEMAMIVAAAVDGIKMAFGITGDHQLLLRASVIDDVEKIVYLHGQIAANWRLN